jgi:PAS domain S-box-containing protein
VISVICSSKNITDRKKTEQTLQESEERHRLFFENAPIGIIHYSNKGVITAVNDTMVSTFGSFRKALIGLNIDDIPNKRFAEEVYKSLNGRPGYFEGEYHSYTGNKTSYIKANWIPIKQADKILAGVGIVEDITERKIAEKALRESEERFRQIAENIREVFWLFDCQQQRVLYVSPAYEQIWGRSRETLYQRYAEWGESIHPDDLLHAQESFGHILKGAEGVPREYRIIRPDGAERWISDTGYPIKDKNGKIVRITGIAEDITERKLTKEELRRQKERLAVTLRSIGDAVIATDRSGLVTLMNPIAEKLTGWPETVAKNRTLSEVFNVVNEMTGKPCPNPVQQILESGKIQGLSNRTLLISRDGNRYSIAHSAAPIMDADEKIVGIVLVFRDITAAQRTEAELLKMEKLRSLGVLAGGIAHDFNNFLTGIIGNLSLAQLDLDPNSRIYSRLNEMETAAMRAKDLTQQLLTFSKGGEPVKKLTQIDTLVREAALFALRGSNLRCQFDFSDDLLWPAQVDRSQVGQVIHNLILNAAQVMPEGGIITIGAENTHIEPGDHSKPSPAHCIKIMVQDQGTGIKKDHINKIFDPYFTTKQKGSGLGLTIVYSIVKKHRGHITVDSKLGVGSTFSIYLPASPSHAVESKIQKDILISGSGRILVMDDESYIRNLASEMLRKIGFDTAMAKDGTEAIKIYRHAMASGQPFDAVILDLTVPGGMGGQEAMERLTEIDKNVKAIVSSGYSNDPVMSNYKNYGFLSAVKKPYVIKELSDALKMLKL